MIQKARADAALAEETRAAKRAAELAAREAARLAALGPHCVLDAYQLSARIEVRPHRYNSFDKTVSSKEDAIRGAPVARAFATLRNTGSTALFYHWTREGAEGVTRSLPHAKGPGGASAWFLTEREGSLRPGEIKKVQWTFKAHAPGVYVDGWRLVTKPELRGGRLPPVALRGVAVADDPNSFPRRALAQELGRAEMLNKVANVVRRVVKDVRTPERGHRKATEPPFSRMDLKGGAPVSGLKPAWFVAANLARRPRAYFHEDAFDALAAVFAEAKSLRAAMPVPEGEEEEEEEGDPETSNPPEEAGETNDAGEENGAAPAAPPPWGDWDGSLAAAETALERLERRVAIDPEFTLPIADESDSTPDASGEEKILRRKILRRRRRRRRRRSRGSNAVSTRRFRRRSCRRAAPICSPRRWRRRSRSRWTASSARRGARGARTSPAPRRLPIPRRGKTRQRTEPRRASRRRRRRRRRRTRPPRPSRSGCGATGTSSRRAFP